MRKLLPILSSAVICIGCFSVLADNTTDTTVELQINNPIMTVNGEEKEIDPGLGTTPVIVNDRTLLPVRTIVEELGGTVDWNGDTREVTLNYNEDILRLTIDSQTAYLNDVQQTLDTAPMIINDRTMLPIRFISESFGLDVQWNEDTQTVTITEYASISATPTETPAPEPTAVPTSTPTVSPTEEPSISPSDNPAEESKTLVVYFSNTGNTENIAEYIADELSSDMFKIEPAIPYTDEDLNYNNSSSRANEEQSDDSARPEIANTVENIEQYDTIYLGYPIWWGQAPKIIYTFLESYDFTDVTIIPFCTSGSSDIGSSDDNLHDAAADADWIEGRRFSGSASNSAVAAWINEIQDK